MDYPLGNYYFAYSEERVGTLLELPNASWYADTSKRLVERQAQNGRWRRDRGKGGAGYGGSQQVYETSLALLCLTKATRYPLARRK